MLITVNDLIQDVYVFSGLPLASISHRMASGIARDALLLPAVVQRQSAAVNMESSL